MKFAKLSVASACALVVGCGGSSQTDEPVSPDSAVTLEQVERFDQAERVRWAQSDSTAPQMAVTTQTAVDASGSVGISGTVTDNKAVYSVNWTNDRGGSGRAALAGSATSATWSASIQLQTGSNTITLVAQDVAGNSTKTTSVVSRSASTTSAPAPSPAPAAPEEVAGGSKPAAVTRSVTCANGSTISQAAGYYASGSKWLLGTFMPQCPSGVAAPVPTPVSAPAPAPVLVVTAPAAAPVPAPATAPATAAPAPAPAPAAAAAAASSTVAATITAINAALVPVASAISFTDRRITTTGEMPYRDPDGMGAFRTICQYSHMAYDDPLVFPGRVGASHLHMFFGNTATSGLSTPETIRTTGGSSCRGGIVNRSAYWVPAMIDSANGRPITPSEDIDVYYKTGYGLFGQNDAVTPFPRNFRMIAGDSKSRTPQTGVGHFECNGAISNGMPNCTSGVLMHIVEFPHCWDGTNLDSPDHRSHVVYPSNGACPATHPVHLPQVSFRVKYAASGTSNWRLSSDISGTPAGSSSHGDWVHGWEQEVMDTFVARVIRQGLSGGSHIVGDGRVIY